VLLDQNILYRRILIAVVPVLLFLTSPIQELAFAQPSIDERDNAKFDRFEAPMDGITIEYPPN
jgi:hypothetical protein